MQQDAKAFLAKHAQSVDGFISASISYQDSLANIKLANLSSKIKVFVGVHPFNVLQENFDAAAFSSLLKNKQVIGIGECGLDKRYARKAQLTLLKAQLELAIALNKCVCIHLYGMHQDLISLLKYYNSSLKLIIHDFIGSLDLMQIYSKYNLKFSLSPRGLKSKKLAQAISICPIDKLLIESDNDGRYDYDSSYLYQLSNFISQVKGYDCSKIIHDNTQQIILGEW